MIMHTGDPTKDAAPYDPTQPAPVVDSEGDDSFEADITTAAQVPAGTYPAQLTDLYKDVSSSGNDMWVWEFTIGSTSPEAGKTLLAFTALTPAAAWKLAQVVRGLKLPMNGNKAAFSKKDAIGRWAHLVVSVGSYQGQPRSQIDNVKPWPDGMSVPGSGVGELPQ